MLICVIVGDKVRLEEIYINPGRQLNVTVLQRNALSPHQDLITLKRINEPQELFVFQMIMFVS